MTDSCQTQLAENVKINKWIEGPKDIGCFEYCGFYYINMLAGNTEQPNLGVGTGTYKGGYDLCGLIAEVAKMQMSQVPQISNCPEPCPTEPPAVSDDQQAINDFVTSFMGFVEGITEYDPEAEYSCGDWMIFEGSLTQSLINQNTQHPDDKESWESHGNISEILTTMFDEQSGYQVTLPYYNECADTGCVVPYAKGACAVIKSEAKDDDGNAILDDCGKPVFNELIYTSLADDNIDHPLEGSLLDEPTWSDGMTACEYLNRPIGVDEAGNPVLPGGDSCYLSCDALDGSSTVSLDDDGKVSVKVSDGLAVTASGIAVDGADDSINIDASGVSIGQIGVDKNGAPIVWNSANPPCLLTCSTELKVAAVQDSGTDTIITMSDGSVVSGPKIDNDDYVETTTSAVQANGDVLVTLTTNEGIQLTHVIPKADDLSVVSVEDSGTDTVLTMSDGSVISGPRIDADDYVVSTSTERLANGNTVISIVMASGATFTHTIEASVQEPILEVLGEKDQYVIVASGQSNMIGQCPGGDMSVNPDVQVWHINNNAFQAGDFNGPYPMTVGTGSVAGQGDNNAAWAFAKRLQEETGKPVYLILNAKGGESITGWGTGTYTDTLKATVDSALPATGASEVDVYLWLQGEEDLKNGESYDMYATNWQLMIDNMDQASWFDKSTTPIITAPINQDYIDNPDKAVSADTAGVQQFLAGLGGHTPEYGLTNTASPMNLDTCDEVHYTGSSLYTLGYHRMYDALLTVDNAAGAYTPMPAGGAGSSSVNDDRHYEFFVDQATGDDTATGLTQGTALKAIPEAIARIPRNSSLTVKLAADYVTTDENDLIYLKENCDIAVNMRGFDMTLAGSTTESVDTNTVMGFRWVPGCRENGLTLSAGTLNLPDGDPAFPRSRSAAAVLGGTPSTPHRVAMRLNNVLVNQGTIEPIAALVGTTSQNEHPIIELSTDDLSSNVPLAGWYLSGVAGGTAAEDVPYLTTSRTTL